MPFKNEKKFDQNHTNSSKKPPSFTTWSKPPSYVPVVSSWNSGPEICFDGLSLDGDDGGGDDDDNLAYVKIMESVKDLAGVAPSVSVFTFSQSFPGGVKASWRVLKIDDNLFVLFSKPTSFNKECFISLLDYAEEVLHCSYVHVLLPKQDNHAHRPLLQSFRFMGFNILPPSTPVVPPVSSLGYIVLCYRIDSSSESSSSDEDEDD